MSGLLNYNRRSELRRDHNLKISILIWKHSSAGMSVRLTRERSWVRAPLFPRKRLDFGSAGIRLFCSIQENSPNFPGEQKPSGGGALRVQGKWLPAQPRFDAENAMTAFYFLFIKEQKYRIVLAFHRGYNDYKCKRMR